MAHFLTVTPQTPASNPIQVPDDGDVRNAASVQVPLQTIGNQIAYVQSYLQGSAKLVGVLRTPPSSVVVPGSSAGSTLHSWTDTSFTPAHETFIASWAFPFASGDVLTFRADLRFSASTADAYSAQLLYELSGGSVTNFPENNPSFTVEANLTFAVSMSGYLVLPSSSTLINIVIQGASATPGSTLNLLDTSGVTGEVWRPTP